jgi:hypothetical protein
MLIKIGQPRKKVIKLKKLIKENSPGFTKREFGDPLPTFKNVMKKFQANESGEKVSEVVKSSCPKCGHKY